MERKFFATGKLFAFFKIEKIYLKTEALKQIKLNVFKKKINTHKIYYAIIYFLSLFVGDFKYILWKRVP